MTMQIIMIAIKHSFGSHCAMICAFARMRTLLIQQTVNLQFLARNQSTVNLRNSQELLDSLEDIDEVSPKRAKDTEVCIAKGLHRIAERIEAEEHFPDHPARQGSCHSEEDIHAHTKAESDVREDVSIYGLRQSQTSVEECFKAE